MSSFKISIPVGVRRAAAISWGFFLRAGLFCKELRLQMMSILKNVITLSILIPVAGCSFYSTQWESAKALWAMRAPATQPGHETYWWDMEHEGQTYRLFPIAWNGKTVLTDAKRWMIVLQNSEITMIQDFQKNQQIAFEDSVDLLVVESKMDGDTGSSGRYLESHSPGVWNEVSIVESRLGKPMEITKTTTRCHPSRFDSQLLRLIARCSSAGQERDFQIAEFDQSGNIVSLHLILPSDRAWAIYRSDDLVYPFEVKSYLDGDVDEI